MTRVALVQLTSGDTPQDNLGRVLPMFEDAVAQGAEWIVTPEVTNCVSTSRDHQRQVLKTEDEDAFLDRTKQFARNNGVPILLGSLALKGDGPDDRFVNRSLLIDASGQIQARYDKIHMFDVDVSSSESYRESAGYRPGDTAVLAEVGNFRIGLTICYDLRFPSLYRQLAQAGAQIIASGSS